MRDKPDDPFDHPPLVRAFLSARYTPVIHDGMKLTSEGESWTLDLARQLAEMDASLQTAGIDSTKPVLAPVKWTDDD